MINRRNADNDKRQLAIIRDDGSALSPLADWAEHWLERAIAAESELERLNGASKSMDDNRLQQIKIAVLRSPLGGISNTAATDLIQHIDQQKAEIERLTTENWQLKGALGYPVPGDIIEGPWINGPSDAKEAELERLNRAYEVIASQLHAVSPTAYKVATEKAQRIKEGKEGEQ